MSEAEGTKAAKKEGEFDPEAQRRAAKEMKALKKANLKAVFGSGIGRISLFVFGGAIMLLLTLGAYKLFGGKAPLPKTPSNTASEAVLPGQAVSADTTVATEREAQMREELYRKQAAEARAGGQPYIAPPIRRDETAPLQPPVTKPLVETQKPAAATPNEVDLANAQRGQGGSNQQQMDHDLNALKELVTRIKKEDVMPQVLTALGKDDASKPRTTFTTSVYAVPVKQIQAPQTTGQPQVGAAGAMGLPAAASPTVAGRCATPLYQAGDGCYGILKYGINTDYPGKNAFATLYQCKGIEKATVIGKYDEADQDVGVIFDKLAIPGRSSLSIQAIAIDDATWGTGLADDVDNHYVRRFVGTGLAALMTGIGKAASLPQGAIATTGFAGSTTTVATQEPISATRQAKIALGEMGTAVGGEIKKQNDTLKPTKRVNSEKNIGVVFLNDVCEEKK